MLSTTIDLADMDLVWTINIDLVLTDIDLLSTNIDLVSIDINLVSTNVDLVSTDIDKYPPSIDQCPPSINLYWPIATWFWPISTWYWPISTWYCPISTNTDKTLTNGYRPDINTDQYQQDIWLSPRYRPLLMARYWPVVGRNRPIWTRYQLKLLLS